MRVVLLPQHQVHPYRRGCSMLELQGEALQVLLRSREGKFGTEELIFGSTSYEDRCWGPDKGPGEEGRG